MNEIKNILVNPEIVQAAFAGSTPFNLKRLAKDYNLGEKDLELIGSEILDDVHNHLKPPTLCTLFKEKYLDAYIEIIKVRVADETSAKGKSSGYRCVALIDYNLGIGALLGIFGKKHQSDLPQTEKNALKKLLKDYIKEKGR
ncbi:MAG: hypothetical protein MJ228_03410 [Bacilli bacterium]|nr:hypothetical protein [Bacilli bacterium]